MIKILIVDDSAADRIIIENMLSNYKVYKASDGLEAFNILQEQPDIHLMILDLNMPKMNGFEVLKKIKEMPQLSLLRVIILTNYDEIDNEIMGLQLGAIDYIRKPIHINSLRARIEIHAELIKIQSSLKQQLHEKELTFEEIFNQSPMGISISFNTIPTAEESNPFFRINPMFEKIIGRSFEEARQLGWAYFTHPDDLEADLELFNQLSAGKIDYYELDKRFIRPDGSIVWVHIIVSRLVLAPNMKYNHICLVQDITERKRIEEQLIQSEHSKSILLSNLPGIAFRCQYKPDYNMEFVSEGCLNLTGFQSEAFIGNKDLSYRNIIAPEYRKTVWEQISYSVKSKTPINLEYEIVTASRERKWVLKLGEAIYNDQGQAIALEGIIIDITDRKATETMLKYKNEHDTLTGLLNRNSLEKDIDCSFREEYAINQAVISINLNSIQALTALYGFHYSQNLILKVSEVLTQYQTYSRQIYRTYENRFAFYWKNYQNREDLEDFCRQLEVKLTSILTVERVSGGIGVVEITKEDRTNIDRLLQHALNASERAIEVSNREFQTHFYDKNLQKQIDREKYIDDEMMKCAQEKDDGGLYLVFQPIVDSKTQKINGFESLARLNTPKEGAISPNEFIPIAEKTKIINSLGKKIILQAFRFLKELGKKGFNDVYISINVSIIQLLRHDFVSSLFEMVEVEGVNPRLIGIELTETVFIHSFEVVNGILSKLQKAGFQIAIDDFGKGYSSLARERDLNIQYLKIDKFFIDQLLKGDIDKVITSDIISMAHKLGHSVIAEGVEEEVQKEYLLHHQCDKMQGFLFSRPVLPKDAIELLRKYNL